VALLPLLEEVAKQLRRVLQVGVDLNGCPATRLQQVEEDRALKSEIPGKPEHEHAWFSQRDFSELLECLIRAGVVGEHELEIILRIDRRDSAQPLDEGIDVV